MPENKGGEYKPTERELIESTLKSIQVRVHNEILKLDLSNQEGINKALELSKLTFPTPEESKLDIGKRVDLVAKVLDDATLSKVVSKGSMGVPLVEKDLNGIMETVRKALEDKQNQVLPEPEPRVTQSGKFMITESGVQSVQALMSSSTFETMTPIKQTIELCRAMGDIEGLGNFDALSYDDQVKAAPNFVKSYRDAFGGEPTQVPERAAVTVQKMSETVYGLKRDRLNVSQRLLRETIDTRKVLSMEEQKRAAATVNEFYQNTQKDIDIIFKKAGDNPLNLDPRYIMGETASRIQEALKQPVKDMKLLRDKIFKALGEGIIDSDSRSFTNPRQESIDKLSPERKRQYNVQKELRRRNVGVEVQKGYLDNQELTDIIHEVMDKIPSDHLFSEVIDEVTRIYAENHGIKKSEGISLEEAREKLVERGFFKSPEEAEARLHERNFPTLRGSLVYDTKEMLEIFEKLKKMHSDMPEKELNKMFARKVYDIGVGDLSIRLAQWEATHPDEAPKIERDTYTPSEAIAALKVSEADLLDLIQKRELTAYDPVGIAKDPSKERIELNPRLIQFKIVDIDNYLQPKPETPKVKVSGIYTLEETQKVLDLTHTELTSLVKKSKDSTKPLAHVKLREKKGFRKSEVDSLAEDIGKKYFTLNQAAAILGMKREEFDKVYLDLAEKKVIDLKRKHDIIVVPKSDVTQYEKLKKSLTEEELTGVIEGIPSFEDHEITIRCAEKECEDLVARVLSNPTAREETLKLVRSYKK